MPTTHRPNLPIPPALTGAEAGSFAEDTVARRLPEIARRVMAENTFDAETQQRLLALVNDLPHGRIRPLLDTGAPDWSDWQAAMQPFIGRSWLEAPLFAAEMIFYRRILEASGYFQAGPGLGVDPYRQQKRLGIAQAAQALAQAFPGGLPDGRARLPGLIHASLWGNQADLSLWPVQGDGSGEHTGGKAGGGESPRLLVDDSQAAAHYIQAMGGGRVDLLLDNCGTELGFDLLLADALLAAHESVSVRLQVKPHPCFVSDVILPDVVKAIAWLSSQSQTWARSAGERLEQARRSGRLQVATRFYWASPSPAWEMPPDLRADLEGSLLIISKGDVNYRRWIGDARWAPATPLAEIIVPPAPLLLLRVSKSDVGAGLAPGQAEEVARRDPAWQLDGQWGVIQFVKRR